MAISRRLSEATPPDYRHPYGASRRGCQSAPECVFDLYHAEETDLCLPLTGIPLGCGRGGWKVPVVSLRSTTG